MPTQDSKKVGQDSKKNGVDLELQTASSDLPALGIRRPWLVAVMNLLIVIAGIAAFQAIEVRELPNVDRPVVSVRATFPGASPETMDAEVTSILEGAVARVSGVREIRSSSEENTMRLRAEFNPNVDLEVAAADIREAVSRVSRQLPDNVEDLQVVKSDRDSEPIVQIAAVSDELSETALTRLLEKDIVPELISITGVADVRLFGNRDRQLRIVVDPLKMSSYGLAIDDVATALQSAPLDVPAGSFRSFEQELIVRADASAETEESIRGIMVRDPVRISDIARVSFAPANAVNFTRLNSQNVVGIGVVRQAQSNTIQISDDVLAALERIRPRFPDVELIVTEDSAEFIRGAVSEVLVTLLLTILIVMVTLLLFLGSMRTSLVPGVAIPVALVGTIAGIWLMGFTINILTLLALVLATGLIVDDAIITVENIKRLRAQNIRRRAAAVLGTRQVFFAVIATTAVLIAVFVPISFLPSTAGKLFREFGFVLAVAVSISSFVALSLVPSLAARLPEDVGNADNALWRALTRFGNVIVALYGRAVAALVAVPLLSFSGAIALAVLIASFYIDLKNELVPTEDRGIFYVMGSGPDGVGVRYADRQAELMEEVLRPYVNDGEALGLLTIVGRWDPNRVWITIPLSDWQQRSRSASEILREVRPKLSAIPGVNAFAFSPNSLNLRGGNSSGDLQFALLGSDYGEIFTAARAFSKVLETEAQTLSRADIAYNPTQPQLSVKVDRQKAADLGVPLARLAQTLRTMIDGERIVDLNVKDDSVPIILESASGTINDPDDLINLYVRSDTGQLVPLSSMVTLEEQGVAAQLDRRAQRRAIEIEAAVQDGATLSEALDELLVLAAEHLPSGISVLPLGEAASLQETNNEVAMTYGIALLVVFLVLVAQFESLTSASVVMITVPFGIASAILALWITGTSINIYSQIGLVMLIGLMAKNGILLVEFADQMRDKGMTVTEAVTEAARVRMRPVMMTLFSTVFGGLPLILSTGPGAEARNAIGWVVFGGLGVAAVFTLFLTPVVYSLIAPFAKARAEESDALQRELDAVVDAPEVKGAS